jgi:hypothetical protein
MKPTTKAVFEFLKANVNEDLTAADVAEALNLEKKQVDGMFTQAIQRKDLGYREPAEVEQPDGSHVKVKYLRLNDAGIAFDLDATESAE